jgi:hypothetical protein
MMLVTAASRKTGRAAVTLRDGDPFSEPEIDPRWGRDPYREPADLDSDGLP